MCVFKVKIIIISLCVLENNVLLRYVQQVSKLCLCLVNKDGESPSEETQFNNFYPHVININFHTGSL